MNAINNKYDKEIKTMTKKDYFCVSVLVWLHHLEGADAHGVPVVAEDHAPFGTVQLL